MSLGITRRQVIQGMAAVAGLVLLPLDLASRRLGRAYAQSCSTGELYNGLLLLPHGAAIPPCVVEPTLPPPQACGILDASSPSGSAPTATSEAFSTATQLATAATFDVYTLATLPSGLQAAGATLVGHLTGEQYEGQVLFESYDVNAGGWRTTVTITANPDVAHPYPLWYAVPEEDGDTEFDLEKVTSTPVPGILLEPPGLLIDNCEDCGYMYMWMEDGVLNTFDDRHSTTYAESQSLVAALALA